MDLNALAAQVAVEAFRVKGEAVPSGMAEMRAAMTQGQGGAGMAAAETAFRDGLPGRESFANPSDHVYESCKRFILQDLHLNPSDHMMSFALAHLGLHMLQQISDLVLGRHFCAHLAAVGHSAAEAECWCRRIGLDGPYDRRISIGGLRHRACECAVQAARWRPFKAWTSAS